MCLISEFGYGVSAASFAIEQSSYFHEQLSAA
jgi:hypothetical protein